MRAMREKFNPSDAISVFFCAECLLVIRRTVSLALVACPLYYSSHGVFLGFSISYECFLNCSLTALLNWHYIPNIPYN